MKKPQPKKSNNLSQTFNGKNTLEVAHIFAQIFTHHFSENWGTTEEITQHLQPKGKISTWSNLDKYINVFCKQFYQDYELHNDKIQLIDEIRFTIQDLPQRLKYKLPDTKEEYKTPQETAEHFTLCSLCWRSVPRRPLEKKTPLCHIHDLPCSNSDYRRRARMKNQVELIKLRLTKSLPTLWELKRSKHNLNEYLKDLCLNPNSPLPYLTSYLNSLNLPLTTEKEILQALEYPVFYHKVQPSIQEAWDFYLEDRSKHFKLNYVKLLTAEAWLQTDAEKKHGGKRR